jgi:SpoIID/LytB domain protein
MATRRWFIASMTGVVSAPWLLTACSSQETGTRTAPSNSGGGDPPQSLAIDDHPIPGIPDREPIIRVRVLKRRPAIATALPSDDELPTESTSSQAAPVEVASSAAWLRVRQGGAAGFNLMLRPPLVISCTARGWSITDGSSQTPALHPNEPIEITSASDAASTAASTLTMERRTYPGRLQFVPRSDLGAGAFDAVAFVPLESYLPGVLAGELYKHWAIDAYAAQAVAARSFACAEHAYFLDRRHFDVSNTASSQVYLGQTDRGVALDAVQLTRGIVLGYQGDASQRPSAANRAGASANAPHAAVRLVPGYYSSCCGGLAARAADAIGDNAINSTPPLDGRDGPDVCTDAMVFRWQSQQSNALLSRRLEACGRANQNKGLLSLRGVRAIDVAGENRHGRPTRYVIIDSGGGQVELDAEAARRAINFAGQGLHPPEKPLMSSYFSASIDRSAAKFEGYGFGHGVGLCQHGAQALAVDGTPWREIVAWYYPGAQLVTAYGSPNIA